MTKIQPKALIALGGNLPIGELAPREVLVEAISALAATGLKVVSVSRFYTTPCFPAGAGPDYVNAAAALETDLPAEEILEILHQIEAQFSRTREQRWGMRTLDLDLISVGEMVLPDLEVLSHWLHLPLADQTRQAPQQIVLPHPRLQDRGFVLVPLCDIAPDWRHPVLAKTVREMLAELPPDALAEIVPI